MKKQSNVLLIIPHYNNLESLYKSLDSVKEEKEYLPDVLIVDDGSVKKPQEEELRNRFNLNIKVLHNKTNRGIEFVLNDGLKYALNKQYKYVARLDCGDINKPKRFEEQYRFLEKNKDIYLVGCYVSFVDEKGNYLFDFKPPLTHEEIKKKMFINNMFIHPAVMFKTKSIQKVGFYPIDTKNAEDYAYFFEFVKKLKTANLNKILLICEVNSKGLSLSRRKLQLKNRLKVILKNFEFNFFAFYGLIRNSIIYFMPYSVIEKMKKVLF